MEPPSSHTNISFINKTERRIATSSLKKAVLAALQGHDRTEEAVCILLTDDKEVQDLNNRFRGIDESTDVLSFPSDDFPGSPLGDIAISVPYAEKQAALRGVSLIQELAFLTIHGVLHLLGYDDETESDRAKMVEAMNTYAKTAGFKPDTEWHSRLHAAAAVGSNQ